MPIRVDEPVPTPVPIHALEKSLALDGRALVQDRQPREDPLCSSARSAASNGSAPPTYFERRPDQVLRRRLNERLARFDDREREASIAFVHALLNADLDVAALEDDALRDLSDEIERLELGRDAELLDLQADGEPTTMEAFDELDAQMLEIEARCSRLAHSLVAQYRGRLMDGPLPGRSTQGHERSGLGRLRRLGQE